MTEHKNHVSNNHPSPAKSIFRLYRHYISIHIRSTMQYKASFFLSAIAQFLVSFNLLLGVYFMFRRFSQVEGFTFSQVLLCFSIFLMGFSLAEMTARGFDTFSVMVRAGTLDRLLVRPQSLILQILGSHFDLSRWGRMLQAIVMFLYGIVQSHIQWSVSKAVTICFMLIGGAVLFSSIFLLQAALCFFTLEGLEFMNIFTDGAREYGKYPIGIYGGPLLKLCTYAVPYALVQYYPFLYLIDRVSGIYWMLVPLLACWFVIPSYALWCFGVRKYQSAGS